MTHHKDNIHLGKLVFDNNKQERKSWGFLGQTRFRSLIVSLPTFFDVAEHPWLLLENSSLKNL